MTETPPEKLAGRCLCGDVSFGIDGPFRDILICHCTQCAQWTGHLVAATAVAPDRLEIRTGADSLKWYRSSEQAERGFCGTCGSSLFWRPDSGSHVSIMAGTIDDPSGLRVAAHICTGDQRSYVPGSDDAPRYEGDTVPDGSAT